jgi:prepilin signal peptidase PulO-like enzyme (type II secretory pathway)
MSIYYDSIMVTFYVVLGAVFASFAAASFYRLDNHISVFSTDRSRCDYCNRELHWWENVPISSWVAVDGHSICCDNPIPPKYALYELVGATVGGVSYFSPSPIATGILLLISSLVVLLDYESLSIYRFLLLASIIASFARYLVIGGSVKSLVVISAIVFAFNYLFYYLNSKRGFGDVLFGMTAGIVAGTNVPFTLYDVSHTVSKTFIFYALGVIASITIEVLIRGSKLSKGARVAATPIYFIVILGFAL